MAGSLDTHDLDAAAGAVYFVVGRGTEGGPASYHLSIAGVSEGGKHPSWGNVESVKDNSGYTLGTIQVDLSQRGTWPLGAVSNAHLKPGETTYVDGVIDQATKYAKENGLKFTEDRDKLRSDLLSHGHSEDAGVNAPLKFIDDDTRNSINAWASSPAGQQWIHANIDFPQVKNATKSAMDTLDKYGQNITEDHRLETIAIFAKTANQRPNDLQKFEAVLQHGGDYDAVRGKAEEIRGRIRSYDGPKAADIAGLYNKAAQDPEKAAALERAHAKVSNPHFDPSASANDPDIHVALNSIQPERQVVHHAHHDRHGHHGKEAATPVNPEHQASSGQPGTDQGNAPSLGPQFNGLGYLDVLTPNGNLQNQDKTCSFNLGAASALPADASRKETTDHLLAALLSDDHAVMHAGLDAGLSTQASQQLLQQANVATQTQQNGQAQPQLQSQPVPEQVQAPAAKMR